MASAKRLPLLDSPRRERFGSEDSLRLRSKVSDLPDLTDKLKEHGIHGEYIEWRDQYMRWRMGEARGAKGENTSEAHEKRSSEFEHWYPTVTTFTFRRTIAFWAGVTCSEGCLLFLWIPFFEQYSDQPYLSYELTKFPNLVGGVFFLVGIYLNYFELINMDSDIDNRVNYLWCNFCALRDLDISWASVVGALSYLSGALFYTVSQVSDLFELEASLRSQLVDWPLIVGGFLFFSGGFCEIVINQVWCSLPKKYVWWVSAFNFIGGVSFWLSACPRVFQGMDATLLGVFGTIAYLVAAVFSLWMWRGEQFGGALIPALNLVQRDAGSPISVRMDRKTGIRHIVAASMVGPASKTKLDDLKDVLNPRLSCRGLLFLNVYIFIGFVQIVACCTCLSHGSDFWLAESDQGLNIFLSSFGNIVTVHMILVLNSACVTMPSEQPYRTLMIMMRLMGVVILANSLLTLKVLFEF